MPPILQRKLFQKWLNRVSYVCQGYCKQPKYLPGHWAWKRLAPTILG